MFNLFNLFLSFSSFKDKFEKQNNDYRIKLSVLQTELGNSEAVQKDFVRLSQSLQMELEKIRAADTAVRWQDDEDIENCPNCKLSFAVTRRKVTIFCQTCHFITSNCSNFLFVLNGNSNTVVIAVQFIVRNV